MADYTGFENFTTKTTNYTRSINTVESELNSMDSSLKTMLQDFMESYPEFSAPADWTTITRDGTEPSLDNLINYFENHLQVELGEGKDCDAYTDKLKALKLLKEQMKSEKDRVSSKLIAIAKTTLENQFKTIQENRKILEEAERKIEELSKRQTELKSRRAAILRRIREIDNELATNPSDDLEANRRTYQNEADSIAFELAPINKYMATNPTKSLESHKTKETKFENVFEDNKEKLSRLFSENFIDFSTIQNLNGHQVSENAQGSPSYNAPSAAVQSTTTKAVNSRPENVDSKVLLNNLMNEPDKTEALAEMGYGDLAYIASDLKAGDRMAFTTMLKAAMETAGLNIKNCKALIERGADFENLENTIKDFYDNYNSKTPAEITAFEQNTLLPLKYACLLYDTQLLKFSPVKSFQRAFSKKSSHIDTLKGLMTKYSDGVVTRTNTKTRTTNSFREALGHHTVEVPEAFRANNDERNQRDQKNARETQGEDLTM